MAKTLRAMFDGKVLRPEGPVDLKPNTRYLVTIEGQEEGEKAGEEGPYPLTEILRLATDMGVTDLSSRPSWYAHLGAEDTRTAV
ncbi:MAG: antitoxin family protein [candidate division NC10 bacterium]|nr:antitoxin family protein [candidate division NC10 bacterium]